MKFWFCGYVSMEYYFIGYCENFLVKLDIMINVELVDVLVVIVYCDKVYGVGCVLIEKLKELIFCY